MCIINHLKISSRNLVIYHREMIERHSTPLVYISNFRCRFYDFLFVQAYYAFAAAPPNTVLRGVSIEKISQ